MNEAFAGAPEMLPMPTRARLAAAKVDGKVCVWCGTSPRFPVKLGPRLRVVDGLLARWLPIGCRPCAGAQATRVYRLHIRTCARCVHREYCPDAKALHDLAVSCS